MENKRKNRSDMSKYLFLAAAVLVCLSACVNGKATGGLVVPEEENSHMLRSFSIGSAGSTYYPVINYTTGEIRLGGIKRGALIHNVSVSLAEGATISPDPASRLGSWGPSEVFTVTSATGATQDFTFTLTDYEEDYVLFFDDFQKPELDATKWAVKYNSQAEGVSIENGCLVIRIVKVGNDYKAGGVTTQGKYAVKFGRVEARIRFVRDLSVGEVPAFWMMPVPGQCKYGERSPMGGEIDIMERAKRESFITQTVHSTYTAGDASLGIPEHRGLGIHYQKSYITGTENDWHVYGTEVSPTQVKLYTDGRLIFTYDKLAVDADENYQWPFDVYFYLIVSTAAGTNMGGGNPIDIELPSQMDVDWVKVTATEWTPLDNYYQ